jgi:hypothetical protein
VILRTHRIQFADGSIDDGDVFEAPGGSVDVSGRSLSSSATRELAALLMKAADEIDRLR